jgi:hypothetical protein
MNRRQIVAAGILSLVPSAANAAAVDQSSDAAPVSGPEELWYLLSALDTLIFVMAVVVLKEPDSILRTRSEFQPYGIQLADAKAVFVFNDALRSELGQARIKDSNEAISSGTKAIVDLLSGAGISEVLVRSLSNAFSRSSKLLSASSENNKSWWCHCWGLRKLNCG